MSSYKVASSLIMTTNIPQVLGKVNASLLKTDSLLKHCKTNVDALGKSFEGLKGVSRTLGMITRAAEKLTQANAKSQGSMAGMASAMNGLAATQARILQQAQATAAAWKSGAQALGQANAASNRSSARSSSGSGSLPHGTRADLHQVTSSANALGDGSRSLVSRAMEAAFSAAYYKNILLQDKRTTPAQADEAERAVIAATRSAPGFQIGKGMEAVIDLKNITGSLAEAMQALPVFAQLSSVIAASDRKNGGEGDMVYAAAKAMELLGQMTKEVKGADGKAHHVLDVNELNKSIAGIASVAISTGGKVGPQDYLNYAKQGRIGAMRMDDRFTFQQLPSMLGVLGGFRTGTAINSMSQVFAGGKMTDKTFAAFREAGLLDSTKQAYVNQRNPKTGKMSREANPNAILGYDLMKSNLVEWIRLIGGKLEAQGKSKDQVFDILQKMAQRGTIGGGWADVYANLNGIDRDEQNIKNNPQNSEEFNAFLNSNPLAKLNTFKAALEGLFNAFGTPAFATGMTLMDSLTAGINRLSDWARSDDDTAGKITMLVAALAAAAATIAGISTAVLIAAPAFKFIRWLSGGAPAAASVAAGAGAAAAVAAGAGAGAGAVGTGAVRAGGLMRLLGFGARALTGPVGLALAGAGLAYSYMNPMTGEQDARLNGGIGTPRDGYDVMGRPVMGQTQAAPMFVSADLVKVSAPLKVEVTNQLTPNELASGIAGNLANRLSRPSNGSSGANSMVSPLMPGMSMVGP